MPLTMTIDGLMRTRDLVYQAMQYNEACVAYDALSERKRKQATKPVVTAEIQAGLALMQYRSKTAALIYAMDMETLYQEKPGPTPSIWSQVQDILAQAEE